MPLNYIITFDYELFGSGKGCVRKHLVNPTNKILTKLKKLNVKATFFVEQLEVDAIISLKNTHEPETKEYCDAVLLEQQILDIAKQGHDIQLHLHPQWYGAKYENGQWQLNFDWWRFSALPYRTDSNGTPGKYDLLKTGKASLEKLVRQVVPNYVCKAFRAGGYNVGTDKTTLDALLENGLTVESSICPGFYSNSALSQYDYTGVCHQESYWFCRDSLCQPSEFIDDHKTCLELPLITINSSFFQKLSIARLYTTLKNRKYKSIEFQGKKIDGQPENKDAITNGNYDICLSGRSQLKSLNIKVNQSKTKEITPIILIGHPKDYSFFSPMTRLIKKLSKQHLFITIADFKGFKS